MVNYCPWANSDQLLIFLNKVLFKHSHAHSLIHHLWHICTYKDCWPAKLKIPTLWPFTESLWTPHRELDITASRPCRASFSDSQCKCAGNVPLEECTQHRQPPWKCSKSGLLLLGSGPGGLPRAPLPPRPEDGLPLPILLPGSACHRRCAGTVG